MNVEQMHEWLLENEVATDEEICLVTAINGYNEEAMLDILYVRTGYRNFEQWEI